MLETENLQSYINIGDQYFAQGDWLQACKFYNKSIAIKDKEAALYRKLGLSLFNSGNAQGAFEAMNKSLEFAPKQNAINYYLGILHMNSGNNLKAILHFKKELELGDRTAELLLSLGETLQRVGMVTEGAALYKEGVRLKPSKNNYSNLMHITHHDIKAKNSDFRDLAKECYKNCLAPYKKRIEQTKTYDDWKERPADPNKKIRIGFFSYRFRFSAADYWALKVFHGMDKSKFEIVLYHDSDYEDHGTAEFKAIADEWKQVNNIYSDLVADIIVKDKIDILVDMIGHMGGGRLEMFALKPAPVQVCWLNYYGTLGMPEMDYFIADRHVVTEQAERHFVEKVYKMPKVFNPFTPKGTTVEADITDTLPVEKNGYITFGSLNRFAKINSEVIKHWSQILLAVPDSRLLMCAAVFSEPEMVEYVCRAFENNKIERSRLKLELYPNLQEFFLKFNEMDILLDPFPFVSGATGIDAAYMGVPSVTLAGDTWVHRSGVATYENINCQELIANNKEECIAKNVELANDVPRLVKYRKEMRDKLLNSPICDSKQYAEDFMDAFKFMWQEYCKSVNDKATT